MDITTEYVLVTGDRHSGALRGLQHPDATVEYNGSLRPLIQTSWQKTIWDEVYTAGLDKFAAIVQGDPITVIDGGDLIQGNYHIDDVVSPIIRTQVEISLGTFGEIYKRFQNVTRTLLFIGTRAHALDEEGTVEMFIRDRLRAGGHYTEVQGHGLFGVGDIRVDSAHVGTSAGNGRNRAQSLVNYLKQRMTDEMEMLGAIPPELYLRYHFHDFAMGAWTKIIEAEPITSHILLCPPLCSMNGYARGATRSNPLVHIGMVLIRVTGSAIEFIPHVCVYDVREHLSDTGGTRFYKWRGRSV
jgi:hypothetical protein